LVKSWSPVVTGGAQRWRWKIKSCFLGRIPSIACSHPLEFAQGVGYGPRAHAIASDISMASLQMLGRVPLAGHRDADQANWIVIFIGVWSGDAGDRHGELRREIRL
jgi:hypothetical protein